DLVERTKVGDAALVAQPENIPVSANGHGPGWVHPVRRTGEIVQHGLIAIFVDLENGPHVGGSAGKRGAVEIALRVAGQACIRTGSVRATAECMERLPLGGLPKRGRQVEQKYDSDS